MSNDRMYLRCECGAKFFLAKWWGSRWSAPFTDYRCGDALTDWLNLHWICERPDGKKGSPSQIPFFDVCGELP